MSAQLMWYRLLMTYQTWYAGCLCHAHMLLWEGSCTYMYSYTHSSDACTLYIHTPPPPHTQTPPTHQYRFVRHMMLQSFVAMCMQTQHGVLLPNKHVST